MTKTDVRYFGLLLEEIRDQNRAVLEAVGDVRVQIKRMVTKDEFNELRDEVRLIHRAVIANRKDHLSLENRVTILEKHRGLAA